MTLEWIVSNFPDNDLISENVKSGIDIFGVAWSFAWGGNPSYWTTNIAWVMWPLIYRTVFENSWKQSAYVSANVRVHEDTNNIFIMLYYTSLYIDIDWDDDVYNIYWQVYIAKINKSTKDIVYFVSDPGDYWDRLHTTGNNASYHGTKVVNDSWTIHFIATTAVYDGGYIYDYRYISFDTNTDTFLYAWVGSAPGWLKAKYSLAASGEGESLGNYKAATITTTALPWVVLTDTNIILGWDTYSGLFASFKHTHIGGYTYLAYIPYLTKS